jgi:hypothetical protein
MPFCGADVTPDELLAGIRDADRHAHGIRCLQLFRLEETFFDQLCAQVETLTHAHSPSVVSDPRHVTNWTHPHGEVTQFSLLNASGRFDDFSADHDASCFGKWFHHAALYPAVGVLISLFPHLLNFRINVLGPGAALSPHEEHALIRTRSGSVGVRVRFHLPVVSNQAADLTLDGYVYHLREGVIYYVNHGCVHAASNAADKPRTHLVWDMLLTREVFESTFANEVPATPLISIPAGEQVPTPIRTQLHSEYYRLQPLVTKQEATRLRLCEPQ